jgi:hypothetical protein
MDSYELAFRMQMQVPEVLDLAKEDEKTKATLRHRPRTPPMPLGASACWPANSSKKACASSSSTMAPGTATTTSSAPMATSCARGSAHRRAHRRFQTARFAGKHPHRLVRRVRSHPDNGVRGGTAYGRDHNPNAMTIWLAGGGCNAGHTIGATDELGMEAVEGRAHVRDFHVTLLRLLGLDDNKLTFYHGGRFKQLSQIGGADLIAAERYTPGKQRTLPHRCA